MGFLEKFVPGYKGYREREDSRNSDKLLRSTLAARLRETRGRYDDTKAEIAGRGNLDLMNPAEKVTQVMTRVMDRLQYANYGFSGKWLGKDKIDATVLGQVLAFDQTLAEKVGEIQEGITALETLDDDEAIVAALKGLVSHLRAIDQALNDREQILRTLGGNREA